MLVVMKRNQKLAVIGKHSGLTCQCSRWRL